MAPQKAPLGDGTGQAERRRDRARPVDLTDPTADIGTRVAAYRTRRGLRVSALASQIGVSASLISQIERGQSRPSVSTLFAIAGALEVPMDAFFRDHERSRDGRDHSGDGPERRGDGPERRGDDPEHSGDGPEHSGDGRERSGDGREQSGRDRNGDGAGGPLRLVGSPHEPATGRDGRHLVRRDARASIDIEGGVRWECLTPTQLDDLDFMELVYAPGAESHPELYRHPGMEMVLVLQGRLTIFVGFERYELKEGDSICFPSTSPHRYLNPTQETTRAVTVIVPDGAMHGPPTNRRRP